MRSDYLYLPRSLSLTGCCFHLVFAVVCQVIIVVLPVSTFLKFTVCLAVGIASIAYLRRDVVLLAGDAIVCLRYEAPFWYLTFGDASERAATLTSSTVCTGALVSMGFKDETGRTWQVMLWPDSVDRDALRQLRVLLRLAVARPPRVKLY